MSNKLRKRTRFFLIGIVLSLSGCLYTMREVNLSDYDDQKSIDNVSYLVVDKGDYSAEGMVLVAKIDGTDLDLVLDPCVYIIPGGNHAISFSFYDFRKNESGSTREISVVTQAGVYYQIIPSRNEDEISFEFVEIDKQKLHTIRKRQTKAMIRYLMHGEG